MSCCVQKSHSLNHVLKPQNRSSPVPAGLVKKKGLKEWPGGDDYVKDELAVATDVER